MMPTANVHSISSLGAVDGPGVRCVVFLQGCPYRCPYCHNPDTQPLMGGTVYTAEELLSCVSRFKPYFNTLGGVTVSGGEPLLQKEFLLAFFSSCHAAGIHTCLDTAGVYPDDAVRAVLSHTDVVLCDIKHADREVGRKLFGVDLDTTIRFLHACEAAGCRVWIRHVIVPGLTDTEEEISTVAKIAHSIKTLDKIELLPFHKMCAEKYDALGVPFLLADTPECDEALLLKCRSYL